METHQQLAEPVHVDVSPHDAGTSVGLDAVKAGPVTGVRLRAATSRQIAAISRKFESLVQTTGGDVTSKTAGGTVISETD